MGNIVNASKKRDGNSAIKVKAGRYADDHGTVTVGAHILLPIHIRVHERDAGYQNAENRPIIQSDGNGGLIHECVNNVV